MKCVFCVPQIHEGSSLQVTPEPRQTSHHMFNSVPNAVHAVVWGGRAAQLQHPGLESWGTRDADGARVEGQGETFACTRPTYFPVFAAVDAQESC